ncbi:UDP-N-acetylenolpyruvoylglucosamine reductase [Candidatus Collierbacteria bacterium RIFOXYB1_FULL_49_13]|uniref:UDP-N-acetylenolpyruvoylglucosamine reductase n=1 Tax=Candidatus Collierbacteria bacterium RIFOXYB1_FULL_49_13 TaxID=1817728 RepID=A0A1F5FG73_9BACT|nr:MAG: UDP-N-acetylenolpyruvoylglucosamine reductase [Candidatus Collierbacteria bacterium RIFOXYB1_FULL_49_13]
MIIDTLIPLAPLTTFHTGGTASHFTKVNSVRQLTQALEFADSHHLPIFIIGDGSDILVSDTGLRALVIKIIAKKISYDSTTHLLTASAGVNWDSLVEYSVTHDLQGIECLSGIPGTTGASPVQNIGAYGQELSQTFRRLEAYDVKTKKFITFSRQRCRFSYRDSIFKQQEFKSRYIIWSVTLKLNPGAAPDIGYTSLKSYFSDHKITPTLPSVRQAVRNIRAQKLDDSKVVGNAGSYFKNPIITQEHYAKILKNHPQLPSFAVENNHVKLFAGWLIEQAGWKGKTYKHVAVSTKNALVLINPLRQGTSQEILELAEQITSDVKTKFGVTLEPEVQYIS